MTWGVLNRLLDKLATRIGNFVRETSGAAVAPIDARVAALEKCVADLEARPAMAYCGVWAEGTRYQRGDLVTHGGSRWHAWQGTTDKPGTSEAWQLCVKRGQDAR